MDSWEKFNGTSLPSKKYFYSELILEDTTDKDYAHETNALKYMGLIFLTFFLHLD